MRAIAFVLAGGLWAGGPLAAGPDPALAPAVHELLKAGRFTEAARRIGDAAAPTRPATGKKVSSEEGSQSIEIRDLRAWARLAAMDWRDRPESHASRPPASWRTLTVAETFEAGLFAARAAWPGGNPDVLAIAHASADALEANGTLEAQLFESLVLAAVGAAQEERDLMALALTHAADLQRRLAEAGASVPASFCVKRFAGDLWLQVHRYEDAWRAYRDALIGDPRCARAWLGIGRAGARLGSRDSSVEAYRTFLDVWSAADAGRPELSEARVAVGATPE